MLLRAFFFSLLLVPGELLAQPAKRPAVAPLTINDFDSWRSIASQAISADGQWLAYSVFPEVGDGEVVLVHRASMKETRVPAGALPIRDTVDPAAEPEKREEPIAALEDVFPLVALIELDGGTAGVEEFDQVWRVGAAIQMADCFAERWTC